MQERRKYMVKCHTSLVVEAEDMDKAIHEYIKYLNRGGFTFTADVIDEPRPS